MTNKARILFVDDEKRVLNSMRGLFRREYELFLTTQGTEAVRIASENEIDVIVADQRMPGMTGIEVLGKIKERSPRTVRILLTGYADPNAVEGSINIGEVFRFLSKPCAPKLLRETLGLAISAARTRPASPSIQAPPKPIPPRQTLAADSSVSPSVTRSHLSATRGSPKITSSSVVPPFSSRTTSIKAATPSPVTNGSNGSTSAQRPYRRPEPEPIYDNEDTQPALPVLDEAAMKSMAEKPSSHWESVTNVVMTEDRAEETGEHVIVKAPSPSIKDVGVVVFTVNSDFAATAIRAISAEHNTILATTLIKVAQAVEQQDAGVFVTDFTTKSAVLQKMIGALKQYMPELVTIVVSGSRDTTDMINLINHGQVFRYLMKPIQPDELRGDINAASVRHLYLMSNPESASRHSVISTPEPVDSSPSLNQFLGRIRNRRSSATE